jgi:ATP-binding cassette, subfamily F, member 3
MIKLVDVTVSFGGEPILDQVSWMLGDQDRVGLVGENGSGKSTLLKVLAKELEPERGETELPRGFNIGYLPQQGIVHQGNTLDQEMRKALASILDLEQESKEIEHKLSDTALPHDEQARLINRMTVLMDQFRMRGGYELEPKIGRVLNGLGFKESDREKPVESFSGGWQMRIALAKLLISEPQILLLDEPTNHLDLDARNWLEEFLKAYPYSYLIVSHDRYFLDVSIDKILEVEGGKLTEFYGNYSYYLEEKERRVDAATKAYEKQQDEIAKSKAFIFKYRADKKRAGQTSDREKRLERMVILDPPRATKPVHFKFPDPPRGPYEMMVLKDIAARYDDYTVFQNIDLMLLRGEKVAIVGPNGAGKSTLMEILSGRKNVAEGNCKLGDNVALAYFGQDAGEDLDPADTVYDAVAKDAPFDVVPRLRNLLGAFLFSGDDIYKKVSVLSGGEKSRLALAKLLLKPANLLLLDEPTNHLDLRAKEVLMNAFRDFSGTLVFVAHDRYFMEDLPVRILEVNDHKITSYSGDYTDYLFAKEREAGQTASRVAQPVAAEPVKKVEPKPGKIFEKDERIRQREQDKMRQRAEQRRKKRLEELERLIAQAEQDLKLIESDMFSPKNATNYAKIMELTLAKKDMEQKLDSFLTEWDRLQDEIENAQAQANYKLIKKETKP